MKYFIDTEFKESFTGRWLVSKVRHYIDLISIGIVSEDGRTYYAISNEFDVKDVWNTLSNGEYWLRDNVLKPIWEELREQQEKISRVYHEDLVSWSCEGVRNLIHWHGKSNKSIAQDIKDFVGERDSTSMTVYKSGTEYVYKDDIEFYGYYADYDWVVICSLFGRMIDLPKGFPMYCNDLQQKLVDKARGMNLYLNDKESFVSGDKEVVEFPTNLVAPLKDKVKYLRSLPSYPKKESEHNALADAKWNAKLFDFLIHLPR